MQILAAVNYRHQFMEMHKVVQEVDLAQQHQLGNLNLKILAFIQKRTHNEHHTQSFSSNQRHSII